MAFLAAAAPVVSAVSGIAGALGNANRGAGFQAQPGLSQEQINQAYQGVQGALGNQAALVQALQQQGGVQNQNLAFQLAQQQALGQGPNPAQAQLAQATAANTANQAALMAGQRGAGANAGLIARQAAMQGAQNQQNMAGQAATLGAQQQLAGQNLMANIAGQQVGNLGNVINQNVAGNQGLLNPALSAQASANAANAGIAQQNAKAQAGMYGGAIAGLGTAMPMIQNTLGKIFESAPEQPAQTGGGQKGIGQMPMMASGGEVHSSGPSSIIGKHFINMKSGGQVPGHASVAGDSLKNDTQPAMLSPGEVVIPRHIMQGKNPAENAAKFVAAILAKKGK